MIGEHTEIVIKTNLNLLRSVNNNIHKLIKTNELEYEILDSLNDLTEEQAKTLKKCYERDLYYLIKSKREIEKKFKEIWNLRKSKGIY